MVSIVRIPQRVLDIELPPFDPLNIRAAELRAHGHRVISLGQALPYFRRRRQLFAPHRTRCPRRTCTRIPPIRDGPR